MPESPREALLRQIVEWFATHGVLDTSMRTLAAGVGTSNRMLHYHFGSREQLLAVVVTRVCESEGEALRTLLATDEDPIEAGSRYWQHVADTAEVFAPLFFELSAHAMYGKGYAEELRRVLTDAWMAGFADGFRRLTDPATADALARLCLAVGRGLLFEVALSGDRAAADAAIEDFVAMVRHLLATSAGGDRPSAGRVRTRSTDRAAR